MRRVVLHPSHLRGSNGPERLSPRRYSRVEPRLLSLHAASVQVLVPAVQRSTVCTQGGTGVYIPQGVPLPRISGHIYQGVPLPTVPGYIYQSVPLPTVPRVVYSLRYTSHTRGGV